MSSKFAPKTPVQLNPPKDDIIPLAELAKADGEREYRTTGCNVFLSFTGLTKVLTGTGEGEKSWVAIKVRNILSYS